MQKSYQNEIWGPYFAEICAWAHQSVASPSLEKSNFAFGPDGKVLKNPGRSGSMHDLVLEPQHVKYSICVQNAIPINAISRGNYSRNKIRHLFQSKDNHEQGCWKALPEYQSQSCAFAWPCTAYQGKRLPALQLEAHILEHWRERGIAKANVVKLKGAVAELKVLCSWAVLQEV